jgi:hypothetical protein
MRSTIVESVGSREWDHHGDGDHLVVLRHRHRRGEGSALIRNR